MSASRPSRFTSEAERLSRALRASHWLCDQHTARERPRWPPDHCPLGNVAAKSSRHLQPLLGGVGTSAEWLAAAGRVWEEGRERLSGEVTHGD